MSLIRYHFRSAVSAFFEMSSQAARNLLPAHLEPMEIRHGRGIFAVTAFDFTDSMVGSYQEIVLAVITPPRVGSNGTIPRSAFYPFQVATSTCEAREHAIERWHLPHYMKDIHVDFEVANGRVQMKVHESGNPVFDFTVSEHTWSDVDHLYQSFMVDDDKRFKADIHMKGRFAEHEEETGEFNLSDHVMCAGLLDADVESYPFRELWMKDGVQTFEPLEEI